jgi:hypothetical protein
VFAVDSSSSQVVELSPGADGKLSDGSQSTLPFTGLSGPEGVAVDGSGDVFVVDSGSSQIVELSPGADGNLADGSQSTLPFTGLSFPLGVAVDGSDDVLVADTNNNQIVELSPGADGSLADGTQSTLPFTGLNGPERVAVDGSGDVFAADTGNSQIVELSPGADGSLSDGTQSTLPFTGLNGPLGVAVDGSGDVFTADNANSRIVELPVIGPVSASASTIAASPGSIPADGSTATTITVTTQDANGNPETAGGATVTIASTLGTVSGVTDNGDGTYTATLTSTTTGTADVSATINGTPVSSGDATVGFTLANRTLPAVTGTPQDGLVLTRASVGTWSAGARLTYTDQWERCDSSGLNCSAITGSTGTVYRATSADVGHEITVVVTASDGSGDSATATAVPTAVVADPAPPANTTLPAISGTAQDGLVLTRASVGKWTSPDSLVYSDQWERCDATGLNCAAITGSTGIVYRATSADVGHQLTVAVTATDKEGQQSTADATPTAPVADPTPPANTTLPALTGTPQDGLVLTRSTVGKWTSPDSLTYTDQWERCDSTGQNCAAITGATGTVYRATSADVGHEMTVAVTATDREGQQSTADATPTEEVADPTPPVNTRPPTITGTPTKGQVLTEATGGTWSSPDSLTFTRQWQRCNSGGTGCQAIAGATGYVYRLTAADVGETVTIAVTATDKEGQQTTVKAAPTTIISAS